MSALASTLIIVSIHKIDVVKWALASIPSADHWHRLSRACSLELCSQWLPRAQDAWHIHSMLLNRIEIGSEWLPRALYCAVVSTGLIHNIKMHVASTGCIWTDSQGRVLWSYAWPDSFPCEWLICMWMSHVSIGMSHMNESHKTISSAHISIRSAHISIRSAHISNSSALIMSRVPNCVSHDLFTPASLTHMCMRHHLHVHESCIIHHVTYDCVTCMNESRARSLSIAHRRIVTCEWLVHMRMSLGHAPHWKPTREAVDRHKWMPRLIHARCRI